MSLLLCAFSAVSCCGGNGKGGDEVFGPVPTPQQLEWQRLEMYMFAHFGPNTFTDVEWGSGAEDPGVFDPNGLDCRQWARIARGAGMKGIIVTAKHHDGFCLWPSRFSTHTVRESGWKEGRGDVLRELSDACREYGLRFGVYVSPWDRNHPAYGTPEYNDVYVNTLREVLTGYGDIFEVWLDGANGEGPNGKRQDYDWPRFIAAIRECQPNAVVFSDVGPDCRWIGNEKGVAGETNWSRLDIDGFTPGLGAPPADTLNRGNVFGARWVPGEADVSIRPGWFYSPATDDKLKSVGELMEIYLSSAGRNANLLLNVPPDRTGRINAADSARLMEFRTAREAAFAVDLAAVGGAQIDRKGRTTIVELPEEATVNYIVLGEDTTRGQTVGRFTVRYFDAATNGWRPLAQGTTIGCKHILKTAPAKTRKIEIEVTDAFVDNPKITNISIY